MVLHIFLLTLLFHETYLIESDSNIENPVTIQKGEKHVSLRNTVGNADSYGYPTLKTL